MQNLLPGLSGIPHHSGTWDHEVTIAGLTIPRNLHAHAWERVTKWTCQQHTEGRNDRGKLFDITATTELEVDNKGLLSHTFTYDAVLVRGSSAAGLAALPQANVALTAALRRAKQGAR